VINFFIENRNPSEDCFDDIFIILTIINENIFPFLNLNILYYFQTVMRGSNDNKIVVLDFESEYRIEEEEDFDEQI
jgi:hypothetical protein